MPRFLSRRRRGIDSDTRTLRQMSNYSVVSRGSANVKVSQLFEPKRPGRKAQISSNGSKARQMVGSQHATDEEMKDQENFPSGSRLFLDNRSNCGGTATTTTMCFVRGRLTSLTQIAVGESNLDGMNRLDRANRLFAAGKSLAVQSIS